MAWKNHSFDLTTEDVSLHFYLKTEVAPSSGTMAEIHYRASRTIKKKK
jgi:hypothetical protein